MLTFPLAPGIHVNEPYRFSLTTQSVATAVPVFVTGSSSTELWWAAAKKPVIVRSFSEYENWLNNPRAGSLISRNRKNAGGGRVNISASTTVPTLFPVLTSVVSREDGREPDWDLPFAPALKAFFDNGGSWCYLCPFNELHWVSNIPDATLIVQAGQSASVAVDILTLCQPGLGLFALLDGPYQTGNPDAEKINEYLLRLTPSECAALYYPWLSSTWGLRNKQGELIENVHAVAPSAVAAGLICQTDKITGPWRAPANLDVSASLNPTVRVGDAFQARYTSADFTTISFNMFRKFPRYGVQLWGARTLTAGGNAMGYISVRRTLDMIERDLKEVTAALLFEPNGPATWQRLRTITESYLNTLMRNNAFAGSTPDRSYYIAFGESISMSAEDLSNGVLRLIIGVAIVRPSEFIELEFSYQLLNG